MTKRNFIGDTIFMLIIMAAIIIWKIINHDPLPWFGYLFIAVFGLGIFMFSRWLGYLMVINNTQISLNEGEKLKKRSIAYQRSNPNRAGILYLTDKRLVFKSSPPFLRKIIQIIELDTVKSVEVIKKRFLIAKFIVFTDNKGIIYSFSINNPEDWKNLLLPL